MYKYKKTLRWIEPWDGWEKEGNFDTGLCNRIFHWEIAQHINRCNNYEYTILLQRKFWPEIPLIELPNTVTVPNEESDSHELEKLKFKTVFDCKNDIVRLSSPLDREQIENLFKRNDFNLNKFETHYYSDFGFDTLNSLSEKLNFKDLPEVRPLNYVSLRHKNIEFFIKNIMKNVVGLHIRRGNGIWYDPKDLETIPEEYRQQFIKFKETYTIDTCETCYYYNDEHYFNIMDNMLKINPKQLFYISSDLPYDIMQYYRTKYGYSLVDNKHMYETVEEFLYNAGYHKHEFMYGDIVKTVVDLYSLVYSGYLIKVPHSTWSDFADWRESKFSSRIDEKWDNIKKNYKKFIETIK